MKKRSLFSKVIFAFFVLAIIAGLIIFTWDFFVTQKVITFKPASDTHIILGSQKDDSTDINKIMVDTSEEIKKRIRPGSYIVKYIHNNKDYQEISQTITIEESITLSTPSFSYTKNKLDPILENERSSINNNVLTPYIDQGYQVNNEILFLTGEWYGVGLVPENWYDPSVPADLVPRPLNEVNTQDIQKLIAKKEGTIWMIVAGPSIVLSKEDYPNIPDDILRTTNKIGFFSQDQLN